LFRLHKNASFDELIPIEVDEPIPIGVDELIPIDVSDLFSRPKKKWSAGIIVTQPHSTCYFNNITMIRVCQNKNIRSIILQRIFFVDLRI
jgi:hypothetical protein